MFGVLDRYIGRAILATTLLVLLTLVALAGIFGLVSELEDVGEGQYTVLKAVQYTALTLPGMAYVLFAPSVLLGSLLGLGALASNSELTVMRAAGVSNGRIIRSVLLTGLVLMGLVALIGETLMPWAERRAESLRLAAMEERLSLGGEVGLWVRSGPRFVNIATVMPDFTLLGVEVHEFKDGQLDRAISASQARLEQNQWQLDDVAVTSFTDKRSRVERHQSMAWQDLVQDKITLVDASVLTNLSVSPENLSIAALSGQINYLRVNDLDSRDIELAFWIKLTGPLASLIMLMLSLPFVFASQRGGGAGQKIFVGILLGIVYVLVNRLLTELAVTAGFTPLASAILPLVFFALIAILGIRRLS
jgi:lipopolysaccharide export system permease protein